MSLSPSESSASFPTLQSLTLTPGKRKRFDDRAQTAVSLQLRAHAALAQKVPELPPESSSKVLNMVRWQETKHVSRVLNSPEFSDVFGVPLFIQLSSMYIAVGTTLGAVIGFNYLQEVVFVLVLDKDADSGLQSAITALAFSADLTFLAAGYMDGKIGVWDLESQKSVQGTHSVISPYEIIRSISMEERFAHNSLGHLTGVPVNSVLFVGDLQHHLVSSDVSGLVFFHHGFKKFLRKYYVSQKLLGQNDTNQTDRMEKFTIKDCQVLPVGTSAQITDQIGVVAVMSTNILAVVSIRSLNNSSSINPITHFKISKSKQVHIDDSPMTGCLSWYPCISRAGGVHNAKLAYAWNNVLTVLELDNNGLPSNLMQVMGDLKDKDRGMPKLPIYKTARWCTHSADHRIVNLSWLNSEILTALVKNSRTTETKLYFFYYSNSTTTSFVEVGVDDLDSQQMTWSVLESKSKDHVQEFHNYHNSLRIFRHTLIIMVNSHSPSHRNILTGKVFKWADRLMDFLNQKDFYSALVKAKEYYCLENFGNLVLSGLPHTTKQRHEVVRPFLVQIMSESVVPLFSPEDSLEQDKLLLLYLHIISILTSEDGGIVSSDLLDILESVHENFAHEETFFTLLENFILTKQIRNLSPVLFKRLVEFYVHSGEGSSLTEIICILDSKTLNIDMTLQLCDMHGLRECSVYIWNQLLHDYMTPFIHLIEDLDNPKYSDEEKLLVFSYMSYILTGRQFPSDEFLSLYDADVSRKAVSGLLFSISPISWPENSKSVFLPDFSESVFPYLYRFLKFNTFEMLVTLNEFFEHPCLNSEVPGEINRQYVIEALLDIFHVNKESFDEKDSVHLSIFIARNYPKYHQFIRLLETVLQATVEALCNNADQELHNDCELALESMLPFYDVETDSFLLEQIRAAKFYDVLFGIYKSEGKFAKALQVWLEKQRALDMVDYEKNFAVLASIIEATFVSAAGTNSEKTQLVEFIGDHFDELISRNTDDMVVLANTYNRDLHLMVLKCKDDSVALQYLEVLFSRYDMGEIGASKVDLASRYIELLCVYLPDQVVAKLGRFVKTILNFPDKKQHLENFLKDHHNYCALALMLRAGGSYNEALDELVGAIQRETAKSSNGEVQEKENADLSAVESYISAAVAVCEEAATDKLWKLLVETLVRTTADASAETQVVLNQGIYKSFRSLMSEEQTKDTFSGIFGDVLELATVANVRGILQEMLTSYFFESEMHAISAGKINHGIYKSMEQIKMDTLRGWLIKSQKCTSCGKPITGKHIPSIHMTAWEDRERCRVFLHSTYNKEQYMEAEVVLFKCGHGYHTECLTNLGSMGHCVLCVGE